MSQQQACLPVSRRRRRKRNDDEQAPPVHFDDLLSMDATEYLSRVVEQASQLPEEIVAEETSETAAPSKVRRLEQHGDSSNKASTTAKSSTMASVRHLTDVEGQIQPPPTAQHLPRSGRVWVDQTLATFSRLRQYLEECREQGVGGKDTDRQPVPVPPLKDRTAWHMFCVGVDEARGNVGAFYDTGEEEAVDHVKAGDGKEDSKEFDDDSDKEVEPWRVDLPAAGYTPSCSLLLQMDQVMVRRVLGHLVHYVCQGWSPTSYQCSAWLYALLARLELPLHRDDAAQLYSLLKTLTQVRASTVVVRPGAAATPSESTPRLDIARLNVLITIVAIFFEQGGYAQVMTVPEGA